MKPSDIEHMRDSAIEELSARWPGARIEILEVIDIAWSGWEFDDSAVLYSADGTIGIHVTRQTGTHPDTESVLMERIGYYRQLADDTERLLQRYRVPAETGHVTAEIITQPPTLSARPGRTNEIMRQLYAELDALERGDAAEYERLTAGGGGNLARDMGVSHPDAVSFKWRLVRHLTAAMRDRGLDAAAVAELAGDIQPAQIDRITKGQVRDVDTYEIMRLLMALGCRVTVDVLAPADTTKRGEPADYVADDGSRWVLQRDPGETNAEFERRCRLFRKPGDEK